jgi:hypothetical protein
MGMVRGRSLPQADFVKGYREVNCVGAPAAGSPGRDPPRPGIAGHRYSCRARFGYALIAEHSSIPGGDPAIFRDQLITPQ